MRISDWSSDVCSSDLYANTANMHHKTITVRLRDLGPSPTPQQVNETIGNDSWTAVPDCDECGKLRPPMVVMVGEEPDYESRTAYLCGACIGKLARLIAHPTDRKSIRLNSSH